MIFRIITAAIIMSGFIIAFFLSPVSVFASRTLTISSNNPVIHGFDEMTVLISSMSGFTDGEAIYIKGAFYKDGSSNYFGFTKNNDSWIKNGDATSSQKQIQVGNWDKTLILKSDFDDSGYTNYGEGDYKVKVGFYYVTSGGNLSSINWSTNSVDVAMSSPDPTVTPTNIPPSATPVPTNTPKPTSVPTNKPTIKIPSISTSVSSFSAGSSLSGVLGSSISAQPTKIEGASDKKVTVVNYFALFVIIGGVFILSSCGILFFYQYRKGKMHEDSDE